MTYDPNIPQGLPSPKDQVLEVQTNFAQFASIYSKNILGIKYNHTALTDPNQGSHESIIITNQTDDPGVTQDLDVIYAKNATSNINTQPQLFLQIPEFLPTERDANKPGNLPMQLTYHTVNTAGPIYQSFLPGGYVLYFGSVSALGNVVLSPAPKKILIAIAYANNVSATFEPFDVSTNILNNSTFTILSNTAVGVFTYTWMAIGVA